MNYESENIEYKVSYTQDLYKEVIAFINTSSGIIYIGVDDNGNEVGIENVDYVYTQITNGIRDAITPDATMFIHYELKANKIIKIEVAEGSYKPYYLKAKGLKPSGVYVRQGTSSVQASFEQIRSLIKLSDGDSYEANRSLNQDLTFKAAEKIFLSHNMPFDETKYTVLGIKNHNENLFTNLAEIISDQCKHTIKIAVFADNENTVFTAHKEFDGSIFKQLEESYEYISLCNKNKSKFDGIERKDYWDYPQEAIREALLNAIVHRDYSFSGSTIININTSSIEFISLGGLIQGLSKDDICAGISQSRNKNLADIFHRLNFIEAYGTGIRRIMALYNICPLKPEIIITPNTFKIVLPNMNTVAKANSTAFLTENAALSPQENLIIEYLKEHKEITEVEIQQLLGVKKTRAYNIIKQMESKSYVKILGRGKDKKITLA